ncbi:AAA family ATPase [Candidatus Methylacidithermus pantelleriae]|uniref:MoxR-like ATPase in aerotolerance operon n=1 Tax=Candidatus Methylacidithermus pantelleriae TaxID=2744239 RepID=A0A8J2BLV3_9BACT|nr:MoxR family ATPase [Candidatus Methylacidithermus pantelleriae]CAF0689018.1 MoxR-like ATPase in aerotolerance operon [Candidatus Methylacidithermus pantelleriae]
MGVTIHPSMESPPSSGTDGQNWSERVRREIQKAVLGQERIIERILVALLTGGHVLLEGMPGLAKTLLVKTVARVTGLDFERVQFTPDLLPSDLVGTLVYQPATGQFVPHLGPIFAHVILADEINRAPAKVQSALLEAMQECQVTLGGHSHQLPSPFLVLATQNPIEQEGTYPLPEAQADRFLFKLLIDYPSHEEERRMLQLWGYLTEEPNPQCVSSRDEILQLRRAVDKTYVSPAIEAYILSLVRATRNLAKGTGDHRGKPLAYGASPRASLALYQASRALAFLRGRTYVTPDLVQELFLDALRHRIGLSYEAIAEEKTPDDILCALLQTVPVPEE